MQHESLVDDQQSSSATHPPSVGNDWFSLRGAGGARFVLTDKTVLRLVNIFTRPTDGSSCSSTRPDAACRSANGTVAPNSDEGTARVSADDQPTRERLLMQLAFEDPNWAGWLASLAMGNASNRVLGESRRADRLGISYGASDATGTAPHSADPAASNGSHHAGSPPNGPSNSWLVERRVASLLRDPRLIDWLAASIGSVRFEPAEANEWWRRRQSVRDLCQRMLQVDWPNAAAREIAFWWTLNLASCSDVATLAAPTESNASAPANEWTAFLEVFRQQRAAQQAQSHQATDGPPTPSADVAALTRQTLARLQHAERLERQFDETVEQAKLFAMKELAYGASHEINNPLANISSRAQMLLRAEVDPKRRQSLATINRQAFRAHEMLADMMLFAKPPAVEMKMLDWNAFCSQALASFRELLKAEDAPSDVELRVETSTRPAYVLGDETHLTSALHALWRNAVEAIGEHGEIVWRATVSDAYPGESQPLWAELEISDSGPGIPADVRKHVFDPFYSGREAGRGLGFGLSKAWRIVQMHDGQIVIDEGPKRMTTVTLRLPASQEADRS